MSTKNIEKLLESQRKYFQSGVTLSVDFRIEMLKKPFLLSMDPLADAIAAGNTAIVKPSAYSPCYQ